MLSNSQIFEHIKTGQRLKVDMPGCPKVVQSVMLMCWRDNPVERPTFEQLECFCRQLCEADDYTLAESCDVITTHTRAGNAAIPAALSRLRISKQKLTPGVCLGKGNFGSVWSAILSSPAAPPCIVAMKCQMPNQPKRASIDFFNEAILMSRFDHCNILKIVGISSDAQPAFAILELSQVCMQCRSAVEQPVRCFLQLDCHCLWNGRKVCIVEKEVTSATDCDLRNIRGAWFEVRLKPPTFRMRACSLPPLAFLLPTVW